VRPKGGRSSIRPLALTLPTRLANRAATSEPHALKNSCMHGWTGVRRVGGVRMRMCACLCACVHAFGRGNPCTCVCLGMSVHLHFHNKSHQVVLLARRKCRPVCLAFASLVRKGLLDTIHGKAQQPMYHTRTPVHTLPMYLCKP